ncbi:hypothetical protein EE612_017512 [Oryza sativa]|nr:hypothetical protein EE612_017512 [Oryza sativa]
MEHCNGIAAVGRWLSTKPKVIFVLGATATGKSKLAIRLAARFDGEVINSDKIQAHDGFPVITNKVTDEERAGVAHHLLGGVSPDADFTAEDFRREAAAAVARVHAAGRLPVVAGGSNIYVEALVAGGGGAFLAAYDCLFLWTDVAPDLLRWYTAARVDDMVRRGLVGEARAGFDAGADYTRGVRRAIGLPEMHGYLLAEREGGAGAEGRRRPPRRHARGRRARDQGQHVPPHRVAGGQDPAPQRAARVGRPARGRDGGGGAHGGGRAPRRDVEGGGVGAVRGDGQPLPRDARRRRRRRCQRQSRRERRRRGRRRA